MMRSILMTIPRRVVRNSMTLSMKRVAISEGVAIPAAVFGCR